MTHEEQWRTSRSSSREVIHLTRDVQDEARDVAELLRPRRDHRSIHLAAALSSSSLTKATLVVRVDSNALLGPRVEDMIVPNDVLGEAVDEEDSSKDLRRLESASAQEQQVTECLAWPSAGLKVLVKKRTPLSSSQSVLDDAIAAAPEGLSAQS